MSRSVKPWAFITLHSGRSRGSIPLTPTKFETNNLEN